GTWYVVVDGTRNSFGEYTLKVTKSSPLASDSCLNASALDFVADGVATAVVNTTQASNDAMGTCGPLSAGDLVYAFTTDATKDLSVLAVPRTGSNNRPYLYLRKGCAEPASELACA